MAKKPFDWSAWRKDYTTVSEHISRIPSNLDVLALLDSRDAAVKALELIMAACSKRPTKPLIKNIMTIAKEGLRASK